jgi:hypothetical protein
MPSEPPSPTESRAILHRLALSSTLLPPATHSSPFPFAHFDPFCWAAMQLRPSSPLLQPAHQDNYVVSTEVVTGTDGEMACGEKLERQAERVTPPRNAKKPRDLAQQVILYCIAFCGFPSPSRITDRIPIEGNRNGGRGKSEILPIIPVRPARACAMLSPRITSPTQLGEHEECHAGGTTVGSITQQLSAGVSLRSAVGYTRRLLDLDLFFFSVFSLLFSPLSLSSLLLPSSHPPPLLLPC